MSSRGSVAGDRDRARVRGPDGSHEIIYMQPCNSPLAPASRASAATRPIKDFIILLWSTNRNSAGWTRGVVRSSIDISTSLVRACRSAAQRSESLKQGSFSLARRVHVKRNRPGGMKRESVGYVDAKHSLNGQRDLSAPGTGVRRRPSASVGQTCREHSRRVNTLQRSVAPIRLPLATAAPPGTHAHSEPAGAAGPAHGHARCCPQLLPKPRCFYLQAPITTDQ